METAFVKMHGFGNDFVIVDVRPGLPTLSAEAARRIADRRSGVGCDQLILIEPARSGGDAFMAIFNADGSVSGACGNAARCVADILMQESGASRVALETLVGVLPAWREPDGTIAVDMGPPALDWRDIPLAREMDTLSLPLRLGPLNAPVAVGMGNPHAVFFVDHADDIALDEWGPAIEHDPLFPERTNVEIVEVRAPDRLRMRVWERGAGITRACGSGACAAAVAARRRDLAQRAVEVELDGGSLFVDWQPGSGVILRGPVATVFSGVLDASLVPSTAAAA